jgi:hypothetical protein
MFVLSFVTLGCAVGWQSYLEKRTHFPPILRPSLFTKKKGKLTLVCLVIVCNSNNHGQGQQDTLAKHSCFLISAAVSELTTASYMVSPSNTSGMKN